MQTGNYSKNTTNTDGIVNYAPSLPRVLTRLPLLPTVQARKPEVVVVPERSKPPKPMSTSLFVHPPKSESHQIPCTIENVECLLKGYGVTVRYNIIRKKLIINLPKHNGTYENNDQVTLSHVSSLATLNNMGNSKIPEYLEVIGDKNIFNPVSDWIESSKWDGVDRLENFYETLIEQEGYPKALKRILLKRWLISAVAAVLKYEDFHCRGVLTLQGPQSIGKTAWVSSLIPNPALRQSLIKLGHHLDASNKDTLLTAVSHWIVEIGELDSSFKKDIARLKGFITDTSDKIRRPYARGDSEYPRRTVFCASVNDTNFLVDHTGNSRWWTIPVTKVKHDHGIDMQQIFAQIAVEYHGGEQWWLTEKEENLLAEQNNNHVVVNAVHELLRESIDFERCHEAGLPAMTPTTILSRLGIDKPNNSQCKDAAAFLRMNFGESKRVNGSNVWRVPLIQSNEINNFRNFKVSGSSGLMEEKFIRQDSEY